MKIIFLYDRLIYSKWFIPIADEALANGHEVIFLLNHADISKTTKWYEFPDPAKLPSLRNGNPKYMPFVGNEELDRILRDAGPSALMAMRPPSVPHPKEQIWVHLISTFFDSLIGMPPEDLNRFDLILCNTPFWLEDCLDYYGRTGRLPRNSPLREELRRKMVATGSSQYDHFALCDRALLREKLGIPQDKKVVTLYAFDTSATFWSQRIFHVPSLLERLLWIALLPFSYPYVFSSIGKKKFFGRLWKSIIDRPKWIQRAFADPSELDILRRIRRFCDENGFFLIMKYRKKAPPRGFQANFADLAIYEDTDYYPYSSAQFVSVSDLQIAFYSSSVAECVFAGTPVISLYPKDDRDFFEDNYELLYRKNAKILADGERETYYNNRLGGIFNFPGAVHGMTIREFCTASNSVLLEKLNTDPAARKSYVEKYIQSTAKPSSPIILNALKRSLESRLNHAR